MAIKALSFTYPNKRTSASAEESRSGKVGASQLILGGEAAPAPVVRSTNEEVDQVAGKGN